VQPGCFVCLSSAFGLRANGGCSTWSLCLRGLALRAARRPCGWFCSALYGEADVFCRPGGDRLSRVLRRSIMGAGAFHGRVRNGIGCLALRHNHQVGGRHQEKLEGRGSQGIEQQELPGPFRSAPSFRAGFKEQSSRRQQGQALSDAAASARPTGRRA
jgi:hypothetical protein